MKKIGLIIVYILLINFLHCFLTGSTNSQITKITRYSEKTKKVYEIKSFKYNSNGNIQEVVTKNYNIYEIIETIARYEYNESNKMTKIDFINPNFPEKYNIRGTYSFEYDSAGHLINQKGRNIQENENICWSLEYDGNGRLLYKMRCKDSEGHVNQYWCYEYNEKGLLKRIRLVMAYVLYENVIHKGSIPVNYIYDKSGKLIDESYPSASKIKHPQEYAIYPKDILFEYDGNNRLVSRIIKNNLYNNELKQIFEYDKSNRLNKVINTFSEETKYEWNHYDIYEYENGISNVDFNGLLNPCFQTDNYNDAPLDDNTTGFYDSEFGEPNVKQ